LQTRKASTIEPKDINWIWKPWQPAGMIGLFAGYGGSGKSTVALSIAAACSAGGRLPDGQPAPLVNTLIFAAEDSPEHTIIPRLLAMGADLARIHIVDGISRDGEDPGWVQLRNHVSMIEQAVIDNGIGLVIIDPVSSYIGDANGDKESDVRAGIMPIVAMAERTGAAVLLIRHVSKAGDGTRAASRILGSTAWHDIPRVAWMLADAPDDHQPEPREDGTRDTRRVLGVVKSNLAAKPPARWCIQPVDGPLRWLPDPSPVTVDECFFSQSNQGGKSRPWSQRRRMQVSPGRH
jgi:putative DNA primase/helicase